MKKQVRFLLVEKGHQESIYLGSAASIGEARQIQINNWELTGFNGSFYYGEKKIS